MWGFRASKAVFNNPPYLFYWSLYCGSLFTVFLSSCVSRFICAAYFAILCFLSCISVGASGRLCFVCVIKVMNVLWRNETVLKCYCCELWYYEEMNSISHRLPFRSSYPAGILYKSIAGRYRPVSYPDGPITARYRFLKNAYWVYLASMYLCYLSIGVQIKFCLNQIWKISFR